MSDLLCFVLGFLLLIAVAYIDDMKTAAWNAPTAQGCHK